MVVFSGTIGELECVGTTSVVLDDTDEVAVEEVCVVVVVLVVVVVVVVETEVEPGVVVAVVVVTAGNVEVKYSPSNISI